MTKLREGHERALQTSLFVIERDLQRIRDSLKMEGKETALTATYRRIDDLSAGSKSKIADVIVDMINEIEQMKQTFELEVREISLRAEMLGALSEIWTVLVDLEPGRLNAYGKLSESDKALIESYLPSLLNKLDELFQLSMSGG